MKKLLLLTAIFCFALTGCAKQGTPVLPKTVMFQKKHPEMKYPERIRLKMKRQEVKARRMR